MTISIYDEPRAFHKVFLDGVEVRAVAASEEEGWIWQQKIRAEKPKCAETFRHGNKIDFTFTELGGGYAMYLPDGSGVELEFVDGLEGRVKIEAIEPPVLEKALANIEKAATEIGKLSKGKN